MCIFLLYLYICVYRCLHAYVDRLRVHPRVFAAALIRNTFSVSFEIKICSSVGSSASSNEARRSPEHLLPWPKKENKVRLTP